MDRNIDERFRKPRQTRGTPLHKTRNFYFLGLISFSGVCWYLWELWPQTQKLKQSALFEGRFNYSEEERLRVEGLKIGNSKPPMDLIMERVKKHLEEKQTQEETPRPQSRLNKVMSSWVLGPE